MKRILLLTVLLALGMAMVAPAQETDELKARFRERLPALNTLKDKGIVGESNKGYVEFTGKRRKGEDVVNAENADREQLYKTIAAKTGTTADLVGQRRALQIASQAASGHMLQDAKGAWYKKP